MNTSQAIQAIVAEILSLVSAAPLVMIGLRKQFHPDRFKLIGLSALVVLATGLATQFGMELNGGLQWNWSGKLACVAVLALLVGVLPAGTLSKSGILKLPLARFHAARRWLWRRKCAGRHKRAYLPDFLSTRRHSRINC